MPERSLSNIEKFFFLIGTGYLPKERKKLDPIVCMSSILGFSFDYTFHYSPFFGLFSPELEDDLFSIIRSEMIKFENKQIPEKEDGRSFYIDLTEKGHDILREIAEQTALEEKEKLECISKLFEKDIDALISLSTLYFFSTKKNIQSTEICRSYREKADSEQLFEEIAQLIR